MRNIKKPFCPECGKKDNVELFDEYFSTWECTSCKIRFDFSKLNKVSLREMPGYLLNQNLIDTIDPTKKVTIYKSILDPARRISIEKTKMDFKIIADVKSTKELFNSLEIKKNFTLPIDMDAISKKGLINPQSGESDNIKI